MMIWDCGSYGSQVTGLSTRQVGRITHDSLDTDGHSIGIDEAVTVVFITVEQNDESVQLSNIALEIDAASQDWKRRKIVLVPFAHLSNQLANAEEAQQMIDELTKELTKLSSAKIQKDHFGSDKSLKIELLGHPGNVRFRSF